MSDHTLDHGVVFRAVIPKENGLTYRTMISNMEDSGLLERLRGKMLFTDERGVLRDEDYNINVEQAIYNTGWKDAMKRYRAEDE